MPESRIPPLIIQSAINHWQADSRSQWVTISGNSMWPLLQTGDEVLVKYGNKNLQVGQIAQFQLSKINIVHRIISIRTDAIQLRGDNRYAVDPLVARRDVIGVIVQRRRFGRITKLDNGIGLYQSKLCHFIGQSKCRALAFLRKIGLHQVRSRQK